MTRYTLTALLPLTLALAACDSAVQPEADAAELIPVGAGANAAPVGAEVSIAARVLDAAGSPVVGAQVRFSVEAGSGRIASQADVRTDATGVAGAVWELGTQAGDQRAFASVGGDGTPTRTVSFETSATPGPAASASLVADTILLSGLKETAFLAPAYEDAYGNATAAASVSWRSTDESVATVAADGLVTATGFGSAWIVAIMNEEAANPSGAPGGLQSAPATGDSLEVTVARRGAITVSFDDGFRDAYENAIPIMRELGLRGNVGIYTDAVGWPDYMTELQLEDLHGSGWSMTSHTVTHDTLTLLDPAALDFQLRSSQEWIEARGYQGSHIFIAPYHEYQDRERIATSRYYTAARGESSNRTDPDILVEWRPDNPFLLTGMDADALPYFTQEGQDRLRALLERVVTEGAFLDLYFHRVPAFNRAAVRETLEIVAEYRDRVLPYHELFPVFARTVR